MSKAKRARAEKLGDKRAIDEVVKDPMYNFAGPAGAMGRNNPMNAQLNPNSPTPGGTFDPNGRPTNPANPVMLATGFSGQPENIVPGTKLNAVPSALIRQPPADGADMLETQRLANDWIQRVGNEQPVGPLGGHGSAATLASIPPTLPVNETTLGLQGVPGVEAAYRSQGTGTGRGSQNG